MRNKSLGLMVGLLTLGTISVQAAPILLTPTENYKKDTSWQNIKKTTYTFADANANHQVDIGETVNFTVEMNKVYWGRHDFDALKVWIQPNASDLPAGAIPPTLYTGSDIWDFNGTINNKTKEYDRKPWTGGTKSFTFSYAFDGAGKYNFIASVICSEDLSGLDKPKNGVPDAADWNAWTPTLHKTRQGWMQGETEVYQIDVHDAAVPEPGTMALLLLGLAGMGAGAYRRRK